MQQAAMQQAAMQASALEAAAQQEAARQAARMRAAMEEAAVQKEAARQGWEARAAPGGAASPTEPQQAAQQAAAEQVAQQAAAEEEADWGEAGDELDLSGTPKAELAALEESVVKLRRRVLLRRAGRDSGDGGWVAYSDDTLEDAVAMLYEVREEVASKVQRHLPGGGPPGGAASPAGEGADIVLPGHMVTECHRLLRERLRALLQENWKMRAKKCDERMAYNSWITQMYGGKVPVDAIFCMGRIEDDFTRELNAEIQRRIAANAVRRQEWEARAPPGGAASPTGPRPKYSATDPLGETDPKKAQVLRRRAARLRNLHFNCREADMPGGACDRCGWRGPSRVRCGRCRRLLCNWCQQPDLLLCQDCYNEHGPEPPEVQARLEPHDAPEACEAPHCLTGRPVEVACWKCCRWAY